MSKKKARKMKNCPERGVFYTGKVNDKNFECCLKGPKKHPRPMCRFVKNPELLAKRRAAGKALAAKAQERKAERAAWNRAATESSRHRGGGVDGTRRRHHRR